MPSSHDHIMLLQVFEATKDRLYRLLLKHTRDEHLTEDMMQEAYLRVWTHRDTIQMDTAENYLFTVAYRLLADWHRSKIRSRIDLMETLPDMESQDTPEAIYDMKATRSTIAHTLAQLPPNKRAAYELIKEEEKTYKEAAEVLKVPVSTLEKQLAASLKLLKKALHLFFF